MEIIHENNFFKLEFKSSNQSVYLTWKKFVTIDFENYKLPFEISGEFQKTHKIDNFFVDATEQGIISPAFRQWFQEVALKTAVSKGLKRTAFVMKANVFKKYYINHILNFSGKIGLTLKIFSTVSEGEKWISSFYKN